MNPNVPRAALAWCAVLLALSPAACEKVRFDNYTVYKVTPKDEAAVAHLKDLEHQFPSPFSFWTEVRGVGIPVDIMVSPGNKGEIEAIGEKVPIEVSVMMENVQDKINREGFRPRSRAGEFGWTNYYTFDEINAWLETLATTYNHVTLINIGTTQENRPIYCIKISYSPNNKNNSVFIDSNIHAREWITSAVNTYILNQVLTSTDPRVRRIAESHDWYFVPIANPDGFVYSHISDRMWRKTRVRHTLLCYGADPNRNWDYKWNQGGSSTQPCSETYSGPSAFSEPSTRALSNYITSIAADLVAYISFHSYSQMLLLPYGHTTQHLDNYDDMRIVGTQALQALAKHYGTQYTIGNVAETIYVATGASMDWVKGTYNTPIAFTYELRDTGTNGFLLPASQIIPSGEETLDSVITILEVGAAYIPKK